MTSEVDYLFNSYIKDFNQNFPIFEKIGLNSTLTQDVVIGTNFITFPIDGSTIVEGKDSAINFHPLLPAYLTKEQGGRDIQILASEDSCN